MRWGGASYKPMHSQDVPPKLCRHDEGAKKEFASVGSKKRSPRDGCRKSARDSICLFVAKFFVCVSLAWMLYRPGNCPTCVTPNEGDHSGNQTRVPSEGRSLASFGAACDGSGDSLCSRISSTLLSGSTDSLLSGSSASSLSGSTTSLRSGSTASLRSERSASPPQRDESRASPYLTLYYRIANSQKLKQLVDYISRRVKKNRFCRKILDRLKSIWNSKPMRVVRFVAPFLPMIAMIVASVTTLCMGLTVQPILIAIFAPFVYPLIFISLRTDGKEAAKKG
ncbi:Plasmodium exported protein, unknown function [Plasmodium vivax]|uniref:Uncharacterized protein n=1 Tax=Plasmodium vivax TaxID=5855 RepID=A0A1G4H6R5_PLAVI|nr:Plasmodium exported protein, unknown function [Plasmodium vivax]VUZ93260.1 Plasmodium exported protein, unknown function [Plasmodium vivax]